MYTLHLTKKASQLPLLTPCFAQAAKSKGAGANSPVSCPNEKVWKQIKEYQTLHHFKASAQETLLINLGPKEHVLLLGLGAKEKYTPEVLRRSLAAALKKTILKELTLDVEALVGSLPVPEAIAALLDACLLTGYQFNRYKKSATTAAQATETKNIYLDGPAALIEKIKKSYPAKLEVAKAIFLARDFINETPQTLHPEHYAQLIEQDAKKHLPKVKVTVLKKAQIQREQMHLLLAVNAASHYEPRFVHLHYRPTKKSPQSKHLVLVGKGITFDTGGYSLKPSASMVGMKGDMGGSATVYAAFRAAVLSQSPHEITCLLPMTDNTVGPKGIFPDAIVKSRAGITVEILNTDAEGRLILADALDYACDLKPDLIIDAATLTGACIVSLGKEVCALMGNHQGVIEIIKEEAKNNDEYLWQMPMIDEYRDDIKSKTADIKNIGSPMRAGTAIGGVFLEKFIKDQIPWIHLDIAGVSDDQTHLPYCPSHGASGIMVRTIYSMLMRANYQSLSNA